jgi:hypothetical protein
LFEIVSQVPNDETPAQVRTEETTEAPKLVEEIALPGAILQTGVRQQFAHQLW